MANNYNYDDIDDQPLKDREVPKVSYEKLKDELIKSVEANREYNRKHLIEIKLRIIDMIRVLRFNEKKEKAAVTQQIKLDFQSILKPTLLYKLIAEEWNPTQLLEKKEKQKIAVGADGSQILEERGDDDGDSGGEEGDIVSRREKAREKMLTKQIKKGSSQMPKIKPSVVGSETLEEDEEEEQGTTTTEEEEESDELSTLAGAGAVLSEANNIVIEDPEHLIEIAELIKQGKAVIIIVDQHLQTIGIQAGKLLAD